MKRGLSGIILAAGAGTRMGGPKALLVVPPGPIAALHVEAMRNLGCERPIIVTRPECVAALRRVLGEHAHVVSAETPEPAATLAVGVAVAPLADRVIVTPVDAMPAAPATFVSLLSALDSGALAATPVHRDRGGHPVVCCASVLASYAAHATPLRPLRVVLNELGEKRQRVPVDDPAVSVQLDTPDDVIATYKVAPQFLPM
jgi:CTP:molybdopterin cytidylyltransferase MocA